MSLETKAIENILADRRARAELERERRIAAYYKQYPYLLELDRRIKVAKAELLLATLDTPLPLLSKEELEALEQDKINYLEEKPQLREYDQVRPYCSLCQDQGFLKGAPCECYKALLYPLLLERSGLIPYTEASFENYTDVFYSEPVHMNKLKHAFERYADAFSGQRRSLIFMGKPGTGKTFMAVALAKRIVKAGFSTYFSRASVVMETMNIYRMLSLSFNPDIDRLAEVKEQRQQILTADLLVIDEFGVETQNPNTISDWLEILNSRKLNKLATIITTNLTTEELQKSYDNRLYSRVFGDFTVFHFIGDDVRLHPSYRKV